MAEVPGRWRGGHRRVQSMMAQRFSAQLDDVFKIDNGLDNLVQTVERKRQSVFIQSRELLELQARLRDTKTILKESTPEDAPESDSESESDEEEKPASTIPLDKLFETETARATTLENLTGERTPRCGSASATSGAGSASSEGSATPVSTVSSHEYVLVHRPRPVRRRVLADEQEEEEDEEEEEEDDDDDEEEEDSSEDSSSEDSE